MDGNMKFVLLVFLLHNIPLLILSFTNSYDIDTIKRYETRKKINLGFFSSLFMYCKNENRKEIAKETFINELLCYIAFLISIIILIISFWTTDSIRLILLLVNVVIIYLVALFIATIRNRLKASKK